MKIFKEIMKAVGFSIIFVAIFVFNLLLFYNIFKSTGWMFMGILLTGFEIILVINYVFPVIFKNCIEEFAKKEELKNA